MIFQRPYLLENSIQHYAWGMCGQDAFIPRLMGFEPDEDIPYAEMWMGAHSSAPSKVVVDEESIPLDRWVSENPLELLGDRVADRFSGKLPFLFKVLSAGESLSIQAHPNKEQAILLHESDPEHYPDTNHKPEITIALDELTALIGFKPDKAFRTVLKKYPELKDFLGNSGDDDVQEAFRRLILKSKEAPDDLASAILGLQERLKVKKPLKEEERLFLGLSDKYGNGDVGLFAIFFMNFVHLKKGEGLFIDSGIPHAYIRGNVVECMANSDNVVRVGLTPKFKDVDTLVEILDCEPGAVDILSGDPEAEKSVYLTPAEEFEVVRLRIGADRVRTVETGERPQILLVVEGEIELTGKKEGSFRRMGLHSGSSAFVPACLSSYRIFAATPSQVYIARFPE